jgi:hypothetical protein
MHAWLDAGTDVATIGAWDTSRTAASAGGAIERDAEDGHVFLIHTGGDGGGRVDVYVDEDVPRAAVKRAAAQREPFLLRVPSGRLVVGGAEDYGSTQPKITGDRSVITVPPGNYSVKCFCGRPEEGGVDLRELEQRVLTPEDRDYYRAASAAHLRPALYGYALLLLFPILAFPLGWKWAAAITAAVVLPYFYVTGRRSERAEKADERWQRINKSLADAMLRGESPGIVLELHMVATVDSMKGGSVRLD